MVRPCTPILGESLFHLVELEGFDHCDDDLHAQAPVTSGVCGLSVRALSTRYDPALEGGSELGGDVLPTPTPADSKHPGGTSSEGLLWEGLLVVDGQVATSRISSL